MNSTKNTTLTITNDFDVLTVTEGLDDIDIMLDVLEKDIPEDVYEGIDFDVEEMMKANRALRDKIHDISEMVITAIQKASKLKKQIITHRDPPPDPGVNDRLKEIKNYQLKIMKCKRKIKALNIRLENLADTERISSEENKLKIIDAEIKELQRQK
jgi:predicted peroxiredoxin